MAQNRISTESTSCFKGFFDFTDGTRHGVSAPSAETLASLSSSRGIWYNGVASASLHAIFERGDEHTLVNVQPGRNDLNVKFIFDDSAAAFADVKGGE